MQKVSLAILLILIFALFGFRKSRPETCERPFIFFDLGDTLIDTHTHDYNPMFVMPGALEYLDLLSKNQYPLGLISDVPESWGRDKPELKKIKDYYQAKLTRLMLFIDGKYPDDKSSWIGPTFDWTHFTGHIILPYVTAERKRNGGVIMFERAKFLASRQSCLAIYETSDKSEIEPAKRAGLIPFHNGVSLKDSYYLPLDKIDEFVKNSHSSASF